jgi:LPS sulfotransferase NodH
VTDANNFVVVASPRTGSNYLQTLLSSHPKVFCAGEMFLQPERVVDELHNVGAPEKELAHLSKSLEQGATVAALESLYSIAPLVNVDAIGFRLFYDHLSDRRNRQVLEYFRSHQTKVIHLRRDNLLRQYLSLSVAQTAEVWVSEQKVATTSVHLDPRKCRRYLKRTAKARDVFSGKMRHLDVMDLTYEELSEDHERTVGAVLDFIGVERAPLSSNLKKLNNAPLDEAIQNYESLKLSLKDTPWIRYFDSD